MTQALNGPPKRAGDEDRDLYARHISRCHVSGHLSADEMEDRLGQIRDAKTMTVLQAQVSDLPSHDDLEERLRIPQWVREFDPQEHSPFLFVASAVTSVLVGVLPTVAIATAGHSGMVLSALVCSITIILGVAGLITSIAMLGIHYDT